MPAKPIWLVQEAKDKSAGFSAQSQDAYEIASTRIHFGFWRIFVLLLTEGWKVNHKRIYRPYKEEGLNLRTKRPRRHRSAAARLDRLSLTGPNQLWSMDFVSDALMNGKNSGL